MKKGKQLEQKRRYFILKDTNLAWFASATTVTTCSSINYLE